MLASGAYKNANARTIRVTKRVRNIFDVTNDTNLDRRCRSFDCWRWYISDDLGYPGAVGKSNQDPEQRPLSILTMVRPYLQTLTLLGLLFVGAHGPLSAQDSDDPSDPQPAPSQEQDASVNEQAGEAGTSTALPPKRTLYFIGPRLAPERQIGPSVGAPKSILPQPLVARGSLQVPAPETRIEEPSDAAFETDEPADFVDAAPGTIDPFADDQELNQTDPLFPSDEAGADSAAGTDQAGLPVDAYEEGSLAQIDPSGLPVNGEGFAADTVWRGYSRNEVGEFLNILARPSLSPVLTRFASTVAASRFELPLPSTDADVTQILEARLAVFRSFADRDSYVGLLARLPAERDWSELSHHIARAHLLEGELTDACQVANMQRATDPNPYWIRLSAFCMAATGNRTGVDFQLGILEETAAVDPIFYQLIDQILVEAEQPPGAVLPPVVNLEGPLPTDMLTATMARLARVAVPEIDVEGLDPLAVPVLLENPLLARSAHSKLVAYLLARGVAQATSVAAFVQAAAVTEEESDAVRSWMAASTQPASVDDQLTDSDSASLPVPFDVADLTTVLLSMVADGGEDAPSALRQYWALAGDSKLQAAVAPTLNALAVPLSSTGAQPSADSVEILARAALLSDDAEKVKVLSRRLRSAAAGTDPTMDAVLLDYWPLMTSQSQLEEGVEANQLALWWRAQENEAGRYRSANLLFTILEALGTQLAPERWSLIEGGPVLFEGGSVAPSVWRRFLFALDSQNPLAALTALYHIMSQISPSDLPPAIAGTLVAGLRQLGYEETARAFALEILISQKI